MDVPELSVGNERMAPDAAFVKENGTLHGHWLLLARCVGAVLTVFLLAFFIANLAVYFAQLQTVCVQTACAEWQLTPASARVLQNAGLSIRLYAIFTLALTLCSALVWFAVGAFIAWRKSDDWLAGLSSLFLIITGGFELVGSLSNGDISTPLAYRFPAWYVPSVSLFLLEAMLIILVFSLFPNGRFAPGWMRWLVPAEVALTVISCLWYLSSLYPKTVLIPLLAAVEWLVVVISIVGGQIYRYRRVSSPTERQQTKWIVFGTIVDLMLGLVYIFPALLFPELRTPGSLYFLLVKPLLFLLAVFGPVCFGIAILRYRLWDIDIIINRTLVYGALTACVVALYVLVVVGLGTLLQSRGNLLLSLLATGLVAVFFQPLRLRLQRAVNRLMYGERDTPYRVISRLGQRLEATLAPDAVLPTIVETVAQALKLPYAAIILQQEGEMVTAATYGVPKEHLIHLPLVYHSEPLGEITLAPRGPGESFTPADRALLEDLARQTGVAVHTVRLTTDLQCLTGELQASRTQLVTMREEERRRLRRDLHDGLGSALTSMTFQLDAASNLLNRDPQAARTLLADLKRQTQAAIADIRRLVYNLRPPILDEWGLVAALHEQVAQYQLNHVQVTVDAPESLPPLPAAVEVAAYRIALEALANVVRHAHASTCIIHLALRDDALLVEVRDNGEGLPADYHAGVGVSAMRERAAELGGSCMVESMTTGGTRVSARLPRPKE